MVYYFVIYTQAPGFSSYLYPVDISGVPHILRIGSSFVGNCFSHSKLTLIDVFDTLSPKVAAEYCLEKITPPYQDFGIYDYSSFEFSALQFVPDSNILIISKDKFIYESEFEGFVALRVSPEEIKPLFNISQGNSWCWYKSSIPARSLVFESKLVTIKGHTVISTSLESEEKYWELDLDDGLNYSCPDDYSYAYWYDEPLYEYSFNYSYSSD